MRFSYDFSHAEGNYLYTIPVGSPITTPNQLPNVFNKLQQLHIDARHRLTSHLAATFSYLYEPLSIYDFAFDPSVVNGIVQPSSLVMGYVYRAVHCEFLHVWCEVLCGDRDQRSARKWSTGGSASTFRRLMRVVTLFTLGLPRAGGGAGRRQGSRTVYAAQKCSVCHSIAGKGSKTNPLDGVGAKLSADDIKQWITHPADAAAKAKSTKKPLMPNKYGSLPAADLDALVAYMQSLK